MTGIVMTEEVLLLDDARLDRRTKVSVLHTIEQLRRVRNRYNSHKLDEVAWELLLELLRAEQSNQKLSVSALTLSIPGVSATTSLRRIGELAAGGYVDRTPDARDGRRDFVTLTDKARGLLTDYLANVDSCLADRNQEALAGRLGAV